jgi:metallo-beta-lactamase family protein
MKRNMTLTFCSGTGSVTGANFLLADDSIRILVDCGLQQGTALADELNWEPFPYNPKEIDVLIITHAHIDHIGRIPKLVHDGFRGAIYSTDATRALALPMLRDTINILSRDKVHALDQIYTEETLETAFSLWEGKPYHTPFTLPTDITITFKDAGHILGSAIVECSINGVKAVFTGDLGNSPSPLLPDTEVITDATYMVIESVYGDRNHEGRSERRSRLKEVWEKAYARNATLIIPTFSLERSQELLFEINELVERRSVPVIPIFFDSPLAIRLTTIYKEYIHYFNTHAQELIKGGDDIFTFPGLHTTLLTEDSKDIIRVPNPKVVIAGSGMSNGGRVLHHEKHYLPDANNILLLTGYQSLGTLGRIIQDGAKSVRIGGEDVPVRAEIIEINGYSGHKDSDHLVAFVADTKKTLKKVYVAMGEPKSSLFLAQRLRDYVGVDATAPDTGASVTLTF